MAQKFANAARAVLAAGIVSGDTTVTIVSGGSLFPEIASPDFARAVLQDESGIEIVLITAHTASATSFTVTRAQEGTTARSFAAGSVFGIRVTAADMDEALDAVNLASEVTGTLPAANGGTGVTSLGTGVDTFLGAPSSANLAAAVTDETGTGALVFATSPTLVTPSLGTPTVLVGTNITGTATAFTASNVTTNANLTGVVTSIGNATSLGSFSSAALASALTDETGSGPLVFATSPSLSGAVFNDGYTEEVFAVSGTTPALSPTNGSIQTWTLSGNSTPTAGTWAAGQSLTLMIDDGTDYTITWTSLPVTWKTNAGVAPTLNTTGFTAIALWKVGTTIYGARVGDA